MKILITGADGMLGASVSREALSQGYAVRAMVLTNRKTTVLDGLALELVEGDLTQIAALEKAVHGCQAVINVAASTSIWPRRQSVIWEINYQGVKNLMAVSEQQQITRFIHVGTANSFGHGDPSAPGDETNGFNGKAYKMDYVDSKYEAQKLLLSAHHQKGFPAIIINPTYMIGPFDSGPTSGRMILELYKGNLPGYASGYKNFVYSKDVAVGIVNALKLGTLGACYIAGNENLSFEQFFRKACSVKGIPFTLRRVPNGLIYTVGLFNSLLARLTKKPPKLGYHMAQQATMKQCYSPVKARSELNMPSTPIEIAISDAVRWWEEHQYL